MTTDRELLELAAKAAGVPYEYGGDNGLTQLDENRDWVGVWNPLTDDGQAMKLAVKLDISLRLNGDELTAIASWYRNGRSFRVVGNYHTGKTEDACRLIVRAAAEIGRAMGARPVKCQACQDRYCLGTGIINAADGDRPCDGIPF